MQAAETISSIEIDDSKLAHVEKMIRDLEHQLDVRQSVLEPKVRFWVEFQWMKLIHRLTETLLVRLTLTSVSKKVIRC